MEQRENKVEGSIPIRFRAWNGNVGLIFTQSIEELSALIKHSDLNLEFTLMQFTGLHDKNGKPIYEGDILKAFGSTIKSTVIFQDGAFVMEAASQANVHDVLKMHPMEIIGNIFENPELLP